MKSQATHLVAGKNGEPMLTDANGKRREFKSASVLKAGKDGKPVCETNFEDKGNVLVADQDGRPHMVDREPKAKPAKRRAKPAKQKAETTGATDGVNSDD